MMLPLCWPVRRYPRSAKICRRASLAMRGLTEKASMGGDPGGGCLRETPGSALARRWRASARAAVEAVRKGLDMRLAMKKPSSPWG